MFFFVVVPQNLTQYRNGIESLLLISINNNNVVIIIILDVDILTF